MTNLTYNDISPITSELTIAGLMTKVLQVIIEHTKADKGYFFIYRNLCFDAAAYMEKSTKKVIIVELKKENALNHEMLALSVLNSAVKTREIIKLENAANSGLYFNDHYIKSHSPHAIICYPVVRNGELKAIFYLESSNKNPKFENTYFGCNPILNKQIAISIDNAFAYEKLLREVHAAILSREKARTNETFENFKVLTLLEKEISENSEPKRMTELIYASLNKVMNIDQLSWGFAEEEEESLNLIEVETFNNKPTTVSLSMQDQSSMKVWTLQNDCPVVINHYQNEIGSFIPDLSLAEDDFEGSAIYTPIYIQGKSCGILSVRAKLEGEYQNHHLYFLQNLALLLGYTKETSLLKSQIKALNTMLEDSTKKEENQVYERNKELAKRAATLEKENSYLILLNTLTKEITSCFSTSEIIDATYRAIRMTMDSSYFAIGLYDNKNQCLRFTQAREKNEVIKDFSYKLTDEKYLAVRCFKNQKEILFNNYATEYTALTDLVQLPKPPTSQLPASVIFLPLSVNNKKLGIVTVQSFNKNAFTKIHLKKLKQLNTYAAIALHKAR